MPRRIGPTGVGSRPGGRSHAITSRQRLVVRIVVGKAGRVVAGIEGRFTAFAVCLRPGADITVTVATSAAAAAPPSASAATSRSPVGIAVTLSGRFLAIAVVVVASICKGLAYACRRFFQTFIPGLAKTVVIPRRNGPAAGRWFVVGTTGKRTVAALLPSVLAATTATATASATAASATALALLVFTVSPWCGPGFGAVARIGLGTIHDGTLTAGLFAPVAITSVSPGRTRRRSALLLDRLCGRLATTEAKREFILLPLAAARLRFVCCPRRGRGRWLWHWRLGPAGLRRRRFSGWLDPQR